MNRSNAMQFKQLRINEKPQQFFSHVFVLEQEKHFIDLGANSALTD
jgi:hypothetical protein